MTKKNEPENKPNQNSKTGDPRKTDDGTHIKIEKSQSKVDRDRDSKKIDRKK